MKTVEYLAGLFDGEGTVTISKQYKKDSFRCPIISVSSTTYQLLDAFKDMFGGQICSHKVYKAHHKPSWVWKLAHDRALHFCELLQPHILEPEKLRRMNLLLDKYKELTPRNGKYSEEQRAAKLSFEEAFLNHVQM